MKNSQASLFPSRRSIEIALLRTLIFNSVYRTDIASVFVPADFSQEARPVYSAILNSINNNTELNRENLEYVLGQPISLPIFDCSPAEKEIETALELFKRKIFNHRKALEKISLWKNTIDELTTQVEQGFIEPKIWVEEIQNLIPVPRIESAFTSEQDQKLANLEIALREQEMSLNTKTQILQEKEEEIARQELALKKVSRIDLGGKLYDTNEEKSPYALKSSWDDVCAKLKQYKKPYAAELKTGFAEIDDRLGGLSGISILSGPPKKGKTSFSLQLAFETIVHNDSFLIYYTTDNRPEALYCKLLSQISGVHPKYIMGGMIEELSEMQLKMFFQALDFVNGMKDKIFIIGNDGMPRNKKEFKGHLDYMRQNAKTSRGLVVIDSLHIFANCLDFGSGQDNMSATIGMLRNVQTKYDIAIFATVYSEISAESQKIRYMVDNIFDMRFGTGKTASESSNFSKDGYLDLLVTSRDYGDFYLPLAMSKDSLSFITRKRAFKARQIIWQKGRQVRQAAEHEDVSFENQLAGYAGDIDIDDDDI